MSLIICHARGMHSTTVVSNRIVKSNALSLSYIRETKKILKSVLKRTWYFSAMLSITWVRTTTTWVLQLPEAHFVFSSRRTDAWMRLITQIYSDLKSLNTCFQYQVKMSTTFDVDCRRLFESRELLRTTFGVGRWNLTYWNVEQALRTPIEKQNAKIFKQ